MIKKLIIVIMASVLFITGCQAVKGVNLNNMILNGSKITSSESKMTASLDLTYNKAEVPDPDLLKVLNLVNHMKLELQTKMQNPNTASLSGNIILKQGKIPFQLYLDKKYMVLKLDNAKKPVRISMDAGGSPNDKLIQDLQTKLMSPIVRNLPNPKHISVKSETDMVHGTKVKGYKVHAVVYANEVKDLLFTFLTNLSKDDKAITEIVKAVNALNKATGDNTTMTVKEFKAGMADFKTGLNETLKDPQFSKVLTPKNYFKTDIFVNQYFTVRKSSSVLNIASIPSGMGLTSLRLTVSGENWNNNYKSIKSTKISASQYLNEQASPDQFLATLDKNHSVLYTVMASFIYPPSKALDSKQVQVTNNKGTLDRITVNGLVKGDVIKVYSIGGTMLTAKQSTGSSVSLYVKQLGKKSGKIFVSVMHTKMAESSRISVVFKSEK